MVQKGNGPRQELEEKQERKRKTEEKKGTNRESSYTGAVTDIAMTLSVAEEANASSAGNNRACSNRRGRINECSSSEGTGTRNRSASKKELLCNGSGQGEKLLYLQRIQTHGPTLQKLRKEKDSRWKKVGIQRRKNRGKSCI